MRYSLPHLVAMTLLVLAAGSLVFVRRRAA
jgi:hypothetical protein